MQKEMEDRRLFVQGNWDDITGQQLNPHHLASPLEVMASLIGNISNT